MGNIKGLYNEEFPVGSLVRVASRNELDKFQQSWKLHHPLEDEQLLFADKVARVKGVNFYHGGDELYSLEGIPGIWHEGCLTKVE